MSENWNVVTKEDLEVLADHTHRAISGPEQGVQTRAQMFEHVRAIRMWFAERGINFPPIPYE